MRAARAPNAILLAVATNDRAPTGHDIVPRGPCRGCETPRTASLIKLTCGRKHLVGARSRRLASITPSVESPGQIIDMLGDRDAIFYVSKRVVPTYSVMMGE